MNTEFLENDPYIAPDQSFIIFESQGRPDSLGGGISTSAIRGTGCGRPRATSDPG